MSIVHEIAARSTPESVDGLIAALADAQHGVVARWQLLLLGIGSGAIQHRIDKRLLLPIHRGVYAVGHRKLTIQGHWMAAVLATGRNSFLSHGSGAALSDLRRTDQAKVDVTVIGDGSRASKRVRVHRTRHVHPEDVTIIDGIPVASVPRILLDLAASLSDALLLNVIEQAVRIEVFDLRAVDRAIARTPTRAGVPRLRRVLAAYRPAPFLRSTLEHDFRALLKDRDLPAHVFNTSIAGLEVDVFFLASRLAVELDGSRYHRSPRQIEDDNHKDAELQRHHCRVLRITDRRFNKEPDAVLADVIRFSAMPPPA